MKKFILPLILLITFLLYSSALSIYFSHDDFFHFKASQTDGTLGAFINLFSFEPFEERGYAFFRPIFREGLFNISYSLFGLNPLPFRILSIIIHALNILLVFKLFQKLFKNKNLSLFTAFFFGVTAANVGSLFYLAGGIQSLGVTMFILLTLLLFPRRIAILTFILALASHELATVTPLIITAISIFKKTSLKRLWPFGIITAVFLYLDFVFIGFSSAEAQYNLIFSPKTIANSFYWYSLWAFGIPEMFVDFIGPKFSINPNLIHFWGDYVYKIFFFAGVSITLIATSFIFGFSKLKNKRTFWLLIIWFLISLLPVVLLPSHKSTYYLNPALAPFWAAVGILIFSFVDFVKKKSIKLAKFLLAVFVFSTFSLSLVSVALANKTFPAVNRGKIAHKLMQDVQSQYPQLPKGATVYFKNDPEYPKIGGNWGGSSKQAEFALNGSDALQLLYRDSTLSVIYEDSGQEIPNENVYLLVAKISQ